MSNVPQLAFTLVTTGNVSNFYGRADYASAYLQFMSLQTYTSDTVSKLYTTKLFEIQYSTRLLDERSVKEYGAKATSIQPAAYFQHLERWEYQEWYTEKVVVECGAWDFEGTSKITNQVLAKMGKARQKYNLAYVHKCSLACMIHSLLHAGYQQVYEFRYNWFLHEKNVFSREDRQRDKEPDNYTYAAYPWLVRE